MNRDPEFTAISASFLKYCGIRPAEISEKALKKLIASRLLARDMTMDAYLDTAFSDQDELHFLLAAASVDETHFFSEEKIFNCLREAVFPEIAAEVSLKKTVIWSAAASCGAEAVSLELLWNEFSEKSRLPGCTVYASDIDSIALDKIPENRFPSEMMKIDGSSFHYLIRDRYDDRSSTLSFDDEVISGIHSFRFNLIHGDYDEINFRPDIIVLKNTLCHFDYDLAVKVVNNLTARLRSGGFLVVSTADTAFIYNPQLKMEQTGSTFYFRKK